MSVIKLENVSKYYKSTETVSMGMQKINLEFNMGEFVGVTGESGSGKSTLLNVLSGLDSYEEGEFYLFGEETSHFIISDWEKYRSAYVGFVFQNYNIIDSYTVLQNVLLALEIQGYDPKKKKERALELIEKVGLSSHIHHKASKLSGGQKQRAVIARALAKDCPIIVADEPTGNLDSKSAEQVISLLHEISKDKLVIIVTHDFEQVEGYATRKIKMHDGEVVEDKIFDKPAVEANIAEPVTKKMSFLTLMRFALRNLFSTPRKTFFLLLMQMIVMLAFTLIYASAQTAMLNQNTANNSVNLNVPDNRFLVEKRDGTDMTTSDYDYLENLSEVDAVYEKGLNFYNDVELFVYNMNRLDTSNFYYIFEHFTISGTNPANLLSSKEFTGTMPTEENEIIIDDPTGKFEIGDRIILSAISGFNDASQIENQKIQEFYITGITDDIHGDDKSNGYIFFSEAFLESDAVDPIIENEDRKEMVLSQMYENPILVADNMVFLYDVTIIDDDSTNIPKISFYLDDGTHEPFEDIDMDVMTTDITIDGYVYDYYDWTSNGVSKSYVINDVEVYTETNDGYNMVIMNTAFRDLIEEGHLETFKSLYTSIARDSYSVSVSSLAAGNRVLDRIDTTLYRVYYPANVPVTQSIDVIFLNYFYNILLIVFGLFLYSIVHAVSKNAMRSRSKDFAIYRSIGAQQSIVARLVVIEQVLISMFSIVFMMIALIALSFFVNRIATYLTVLTFVNYLYLFVIFILFGVWLGLRFNKRVFKQSVIENINLSKEDN
jgi:ABC-type lipoprotein export system ATPase subunit